MTKKKTMKGKKEDDRTRKKRKEIKRQKEKEEKEEKDEREEYLVEFIFGRAQTIDREVAQGRGRKLRTGPEGGVQQAERMNKEKKQQASTLAASESNITKKKSTHACEVGAHIPDHGSLGVPHELEIDVVDKPHVLEGDPENVVDRETRTLCVLVCYVFVAL